MRFEKKVLDSMERCYSTGSVTIDGAPYLLLASEAEGGGCNAYTGPDFSRKETVWTDAGGTMSIVEIPDTNGEFFAIQNFFPGFRSERAKLVRGRREQDGRWTTRDVLNLPYVHRFDIFTAGGVSYLLACTVCTSKKDREDWSDPGKVYIGVLERDPAAPLVLTVLMDGLYRNHGYTRAQYKGHEAAYITCDLGVFVLTPPAQAGGEWAIAQLMDHPVGDVAVVDMDGDGEDELAVIEPFHGNAFKIYKNANGAYHEVYSYPNEIDFAHAVWGGLLRGKPAVIGGIRRVNCELFLVTHGEAGYETLVLEQGGGPSNVAVVCGAQRDVILCANHTKNEAALYFVTDEP